MKFLKLWLKYSFFGLCFSLFALLILICKCKLYIKNARRAPFTKQTMIRGIISSKNLDECINDPLSFHGQTILSDLFEGLVLRLPDGKVGPGVATHWTSLEGKEESWSFFLDPKARWSDNQPVVSSDFARAFYVLFEKARNNNALSRHLSYLCKNFLPILNAEAVLSGEKPVKTLGVSAFTPYCFQIHLDHPRREILVLEALTQPYFLPFPVKSIKECVNGPFVLNLEGNQTPLKNEQWILKKNKHYRNQKRINLQNVLYRRYSSEIEAIQAFKDNSIDLLEIDKQALSDDLSGRASLTGKSKLWDLIPNWNHPVLQDKEIRDVIALIVHLSALSDKKETFFVEKQLGLVNFSNRVGKIYPRWWNIETCEQIEWVEEVLEKNGYSEQNPCRLELVYEQASSEHLQDLKEAFNLYPQIEFSVQKISNDDLRQRIKEDSFMLYLNHREIEMPPYFRYSRFFDSSTQNIGKAHGFLKKDIFESFIGRSASLAFDVYFYKEYEHRFFIFWPTIPWFCEHQIVLLQPSVGGMPDLVIDPKGRLPSRWFWIRHPSQEMMDQAKFLSQQELAYLKEQAYLFFW